MTPQKYAASIYALNLQMTLMAAEAHSVMVYRCLGLAGLWPSSPNERHRMVSEKPPAFVAAGVAATLAALSGKSPPEVAGAALKPIRSKTRANAKRLSKRS